MYEDTLREMKIILPPSPRPLAAYEPAVRTGDIIYTSGQLPMQEGKLQYKGKLGEHLSEEDGYQAARICALNGLSAIKGLVGSLDEIEKIVKITGFVNGAPGFWDHPAVLNGASDFLLEVFGEAGRHARSAVGVSELPLGAAVELEMVVKVRSDG